MPTTSASLFLNNNIDTNSQENSYFDEGYSGDERDRTHCAGDLLSSNDEARSKERDSTPNLKLSLFGGMHEE